MTNHEQQKRYSGNAYEAFPTPSSSPSLPWLVEYWSSSFFQTPTAILESMLTSCTTTDTTMEREVSLQPSIKDATSRQAEAGHDATTVDDDYYDHRMETLWRKNNSERYPSYSQRFPSIRKSSILLDDDDDDNAQKVTHASMDYSDDEPREGTSAITTTTATSCNLADWTDYSSRSTLYTCDSFLDKSKSCNNTSPNGRVRLAPRFGWKQESNNDDDDALTRVCQSQSSSRTQHQQRLQPPPSPSATTYTTVSLSHSYNDSLFDMSADEDDDDDEEELLSPKDVMERWSQASSSLFRNTDNQVEEESSTTSNNNNHSDCIYSTPQHSITRKRLLHSPPPIKAKKALQQQDGEAMDQETTEPYRYLIRMEPQNYRHGAEETKFDIGDVEEDQYSLPSHLELHSNMTFHEAFFSSPTTTSTTTKERIMNSRTQRPCSRECPSSTPPSMPEF